MLDKEKHGKTLYEDANLSERRRKYYLTSVINIKPDQTPIIWYIKYLENSQKTEY
jgi:hypothetical protein